MGKAHSVLNKMMLIQEESMSIMISAIDGVSRKIYMPEAAIQISVGI